MSNALRTCENLASTCRCKIRAIPYPYNIYSTLETQLFEVALQKLDLPYTTKYIKGYLKWNVKPEIIETS